MSMAAFDASVYEQLTLGVAKTLGKRQGVCDLHYQKSVGASKQAISEWETKYACVLPEDLKNFYLTTNGLNLTWNAKVSTTDGKVNVGNVWINPIECLIRVNFAPYKSGDDAGEKDIGVTDEENEEHNLPKFDHSSRIFELDHCKGFGKVCLVYRHTKPGLVASAHSASIWFLDRCLQWFPLMEGFLSYFRLMITYLGLPYWQCVHTNIGLPTQFQQWYNLYCPLRAQQTNVDVSPAVQHFPATINADKAFKGKTDKKKGAGNQTATATVTSGGLAAKKRFPTSGNARSATQTSQRTNSQGKPFK